MLAICVGQPWPEKHYPNKEICGYKLDKVDSFHEFVVYDEINRVGAGGIQWGILGALGIGLPPVIKFGS